MNKPGPVSALILLALVVAIAYANSLTVDFVYDDYAFVYNNEAIRTFRPLSKFLISPETFSQPVSYHVYRPLASFTFAINHALNGLEPSGYHIVNLLFHLFNVFLVFLLLRQIGFQQGPSFAGALLFAIHPIHTEAVTWISGRGNVLFLFFFLLSYSLYIRSDSHTGARRFVLYLGTVVTYGISLLAKEMAFPLPLILFGHDLYFHREWNARQRLKRLWLYVPFILLAIGYLFLRAQVLGRMGQVSYHGGSAHATFLAMLRAVVIYARLLFVPVGLSLSRHFRPSYSIFDMTVFPNFCIVVLGIIAGAVTFRRAALFSFSLYWFAVTLLPVSNIIPVNALVADRFLYGPSIGFSILIAAWISAFLKVEGSKKLLATAALTAAVFWLTVLSVGRNNDWRNAFLLWSKTARNSPTSFVAFNNLGFEYMKRGQIPEAIEALNKAVEIRDDLPETHLNLARCYSKIGRTDEAIRNYESALAHLEKTAEVRYELGMLLERRGSIGDAIAQYEAAIMENASLPGAHRRLAIIYKTRDIVQAVEHFEKVVSLAPDDSDAHYELALMYYKQKDLSNATKALRKSLELDPHNRPARRLLEHIEKNPDTGQISD